MFVELCALLLSRKFIGDPAKITHKQPVSIAIVPPVDTMSVYDESAWYPAGSDVSSTVFVLFCKASFPLLLTF